MNQDRYHACLVGIVFFLNMFFQFKRRKGKTKPKKPYEYFKLSSRISLGSWEYVCLIFFVAKEEICWWLTPTILATQEAAIRRIVVWSQPGQIVRKTLSQKNLSQKRAGGMSQGVGPEFKSWYWEKKMFTAYQRIKVISGPCGIEWSWTSCLFSHGTPVLFKKIGDWQTS
jgi:hypothetical protein